MKSRNKINVVGFDLDVSEICCDLDDATLEIVATQDQTLTVRYAEAKNIDVAGDKNRLIIHQDRKPFFLRRPQVIRVSVPSHTVPDLDVAGRDYRLSVSDGIYGDLNALCDDGRVELVGCSFENAEINGASLSAVLNGVTVKNTLIAKCKNGEITCEDTFASCAECRVKRGNVGMSAFNCKDSVLEAQYGNLTASVVGGESDYNLTLVVKEGTANRESALHDGASRTLKAYAEKGNVAIDFVADEAVRMDEKE